MSNEAERKKRKYGEFEEPREVEIQYTWEMAVKEYEEEHCTTYDEDDEQANAIINWIIGESIDHPKIAGWYEIPPGCEPTDEDDAEEYADYLDNKDLIPDDEDFE
jgi:hypothetical protein